VRGKVLMVRIGSEWYGVVVGSGGEGKVSWFYLVYLSSSSAEK